MSLIPYKNVKLPAKWLKKIEENKRSTKSENSIESSSNEVNLFYNLGKIATTSTSFEMSEKKAEISLAASGNEIEKFYFPSYSHYLLHMRREKLKKRRLYKFIKRKDITTGLDAPEEHEEHESAEDFIPGKYKPSYKPPSADRMLSTEEKNEKKLAKKQKFEKELIFLLKEEARISTAHGMVWKLFK